MRDYGALIWQLFLIYLLAWKFPIGGTVQYRPALTINFFTICKHVCTGYLASYLLNAPIRVLVPYTWHSTKSSAAEYTLIMPMLWPNSATEPWGLNQWKRKISICSLYHPRLTRKSLSWPMETIGSTRTNFCSSSMDKMSGMSILIWKDIIRFDKEAFTLNDKTAIFCAKKLSIDGSNIELIWI